MLTYDWRKDRIGSPSAASLNSSSQLYTDNDVIGNFLNKIPGLPPADETKEYSFEDLKNDITKAGKKYADSEGGDQAAKLIHAAGSMSSSEQHLGNTCSSEEEELAGLCYKKCSLLTDNKFSVRLLPNACCKADKVGKSCASFDMQSITWKAPVPGYGYTVGAGSGTLNMPHPTGSCASNEEGHLGWCFKKCSLLTDDKYPIRITANICCKAKPCWNFMNLKTGLGVCSGFNVGGQGDCPQPRTSTK
jgi:hypothetical protein